MSPGAARPLRVAVLTRALYPLHGYGGLERHVFDLVRHLLDRNVHITLITQRERADRSKDTGADAVLRHPGLLVKTMPYWTFPLAGRRGTTVLDRGTAYLLFGWRAGRFAGQLSSAGSVDIVHGLGASALGYALGRDRYPSPFVFNPQGLEEFGATDPRRAPLKRLGYWPLRAAVRKCAQAADRVIATDRVLVQPVLTHLGVAPDVVRVIPNAIDIAACDRPDSRTRAIALRAQIGLRPDDVLFFSVGRLEANKGFGVFIRALGELVGSGTLTGSAWRWVLAGDGPQRNALEREIARHRLDGRVQLVGRVSTDELHGWYETATLFVHPTLYEGSSLVTLEAMAHRRAVVASAAGGLPDKVKPGLNGWLVQPGDVSGLASAVQDALSDRGRLTRMGAESRALVEREFSWAAVVERQLALYDELLASSTRRPRAGGASSD